MFGFVFWNNGRIERFMDGPLKYWPFTKEKQSKCLFKSMNFRL